MKRRGSALMLLAALAAAGLSGDACGYSLAGRGSFLPVDIKTIGIPNFVNRTTVFNLETQLTQKVRAEFIGRGRYQILPEATNVDALLVGEVSNVSLLPQSFTGNGALASRYSITMTARVELRDVRTNTVLWENPALISRQDYDAPGATAGVPADPAQFFGQDQNALDRMSTEFARTIVSAILEAF
jgi:hypothetical protein